MMTTEEKIINLHNKMNVLRLKQEKQKTAVFGAGSVILAVCVVMLILNASEGGNGSSGTASLYSGATMLYENAGGYVTAAIFAFMVGVIVTVICIKQRKKHENRKNNKPEEKNEK